MYISGFGVRGSGEETEGQNLSSESVFSSRPNPHEWNESCSAGSLGVEVRFKGSGCQGLGSDVWGLALSVERLEFITEVKAYRSEFRVQNLELRK